MDLHGTAPCWHRTTAVEAPYALGVLPSVGHTRHGRVTSPLPLALLLNKTSYCPAGSHKKGGQCF